MQQFTAFYQTSSCCGSKGWPFSRPLCVWHLSEMLCKSAAWQLGLGFKGLSLCS
uniref:Uncharacterized protein n=1 Tax=Rhizophora mucronata TaxID=61149 RepID=A0A2P2II85_RHIMU